MHRFKSRRKCRYCVVSYAALCRLLRFPACQSIQLLHLTDSDLNFPRVGSLASPKIPAS